jgi:hypothetical protein
MKFGGMEALASYGYGGGRGIRPGALLGVEFVPRGMVGQQAKKMTQMRIPHKAPRAFIDFTLQKACSHNPPRPPILSCKTSGV